MKKFSYTFFDFCREYKREMTICVTLQLILASLPILAYLVL
jgi:hypothetical protein